MPNRWMDQSSSCAWFIDRTIGLTIDWSNRTIERARSWPIHQSKTYWYDFMFMCNLIGWSMDWISIQFLTSQPFQRSYIWAIAKNTNQTISNDRPNYGAIEQSNVKMHDRAFGGQINATTTRTSLLWIDQTLDDRNLEFWFQPHLRFDRFSNNRLSSVA